MLNPLLVKILWLQRSKWHFAFAGLAFLFGMLLVLAATEVYYDIKYLAAERKTADNYIIINKQITLSNTLGLASSEFSEAELDSLARQPFIKKIGRFEPNQFQASIRTNQFINFFTLAFFEAIPDEFIDINKSEWIWEDENDPLPIVLSIDFLNMYNFGFALSQGLPQVSKEAIKMVPLEVLVQGEGGMKKLNAKVVGFSNRIPSVLVPLKFMRWANTQIAKKAPGQPSRLILEVTGLDDPRLKKYLQSKKYITKEDQLLAGQTANILNTSMAAIGTLGVFLWVLAFVIFSGNFRLIIAESLPEIILLKELGYTSKTIIWHLMSFFIAYVLLLFVLVAAGLWHTDTYLYNYLQKLNLETPTGVHWQVWLVGITIMAMMILLNILLIYRQFNKKVQI